MTEDPNALPPKAAPSDEAAHVEAPHQAVPASDPAAAAPPTDQTPTPAPVSEPLTLRWAPPADTGSPPRLRVDPEDIRMALEEQAKKRPPRPPVNDLGPPIPKLKVPKPRYRKHKP